MEFKITYEFVSGGYVLAETIIKGKVIRNSHLTAEEAKRGLIEKVREYFNLPKPEIVTL